MKRRSLRRFMAALFLTLPLTILLFPAGAAQPPIREAAGPPAGPGSLLDQLAPVDRTPEFGFGDADDAEKILVFGSFTAPQDDEPARLFVSAKLGPKWHVYSLTQPGGNLKPTRVKLDPSDQYQLLGNFVPDRAPVVRKTELYDVSLEEHYDAVTFSAPIQITAGVDMAELQITGELEGTVCHDEIACMQLADIDTKFAAKLATGRDAADLLALLRDKRPGSPSRETPATLPDAATPSEAEAQTTTSDSSNYRAAYSHATISGHVTPQVARPGSTVALVISATPDPSYHVYAYAEKEDAGIAYKPTRIVLQQPPGWTLRPPTASTPVVVGRLEGVPDYYYHEGSVTWTAEIDVPSNAEPGEYTLEGFLAYQTCSTQCDPPAAVAFSARVSVGSPSVPGEVALVFSSSVSYGEVARLADAAAEKLSSSHGDTETSPAVQGFSLDETAKNTAKQYEGYSAWVFVGIILPIAFVGGFLLNLMPCVLPVLGLKIMGFVSQAGESRGRIFMLNVWYALGLLFVFMVLATPMALWTAADSAVSQADDATGWGWGQQFNYDGFNIPLIAVVFVMALSFFGVWEIPIPGFATGSTATKLAEKEGPLGAFSKGVVTTLLATPCTAPGLGFAIMWCAALPAHLVYVVFAVIALGMAAPYLLIGAFPALIRFLPKPGPWMETFKQMMSFVLLGTVVWLFTFIKWTNMVPTLALMFGLWAACWWIGRVPMTALTGQKTRAWIGATVFATLIGLFAFSPGIEVGGFPVPGLGGMMQYRYQTTVDDAVALRMEDTVDDEPTSEFELPWERFSLARLEELTAANKTVMVDFTASWCLTCKTLEQFVLNTRDVREVVDRNGVVPLLADWSNRDRESDVGKVMMALGSKQVPVLAIFPAGRPNEPVILRSGYTKGGLIKELEEAGPSRDADESSRAAMRVP